MHIASTRFGTLEVRDDALLTFPDGLIGLPGKHYAFLSDDSSSPFMWLHAAEHPEVAVPIVNPWLFFVAYEVRVPEEDARRLELETPDQADIFCVVRAAERLEDFTVNLAGPVIVHADRRLGRQIINDAGGYPVRQPLFSEVQLKEVQPASNDSPAAAAV